MLKLGIKFILVEYILQSFEVAFAVNMVQANESFTVVRQALAHPSTPPETWIMYGVASRISAAGVITK